MPLSPGQKVALWRAWWEGERMWIRVAPADTARGPVWRPDLEVSRLARDQDRVYLGLTSYPFDLDDEVEGHCVVQLLSPEQILVPEQPDSLEGIFLQEAAQRVLRPEAELREQLDELLGSPPHCGSEEFIEQCRRERQIQRPFRLGPLPVPPTACMRLVGLQREPARLCIRLAADGQEEAFEVLAAWQDVLALEPTQRTLVGWVAPVQVARLTAEGLVEVDDESFARATRAWLDRLESPGRPGRLRLPFRLLRSEQADELAERMRRLLPASPVEARTPGDSPGSKPPPPSPHGPVDPPWIGRRLGRYRLEELLGEGICSQVYRGLHQDGYAQLAFKLAKEQPRPARPDFGATMAGRPGPAGWSELLPEPAWLLAQQAARLMGVRDPGLVSVEELVLREEVNYYSMELLQGQPLRALMRQGPVPLSVFLRVVHTLGRLTRHPSFPYHGDLKPDNVLVSPRGVHLIDPGYFGPDRFVTTLAYYPRLTPDDFLAFGLILWEAAAGEHPLRSVELPLPPDWRPRPPPGPEPVRDLLNRALTPPGFTQWGDVVSTLEGLLDRGLTHL